MSKQETGNNTVTVDNETIEKITATFEKMLGGDLNARIVGLSADHPLKPLVSAINGTFDLMDSYTRESATAIDYCSNDKFYRPLLPQGLPGIFRQSANVINKGGMRMRTSHDYFNEIADLTEENASAVTTIAAACEELSATNEEITKSAESTVNNSQSTSEQARELSISIQKMGEALSSIDSTIAKIENISAQTHLLALNAMIEASRAGSRGSRFEVVAKEVKELAKSTSNATEEIKSHILQIHQVATETGLSFEKIENSITSIDESSNMIRTSLENQVTATQEVTANITSVSYNMETVSEKIKTLRHQ